MTIGKVVGISFLVSLITSVFVFMGMDQLTRGSAASAGEPTAAAEPATPPAPPPSPPPEPAPAPAAEPPPPEPPSPARIPEVAGVDLDSAVRQLEALGLLVDTSERVASEEVAKGQVISADPAVGTLVDPGTRVKLVVSEGAPEVEVPVLRRRRIEQAKIVIRKSGFKVGTITFRDHPEAIGGSVLKQTPEAGTTAPKGSAIDLVVNTFE